MQFRKLFFSLCCMVALGVSLAACSEDEELFDDSGSKVTLPVHRAFILNEGTQGANNATLSFYAPDGNADFIKDIFYTQNQAKLGDTGQALIEYNNDLYAIISGSRYLIRMNTAGVEKQRYEIPASEGDPRYLVADDGYIYMTQYGGRVTKLDANTLKVVATFTGGNNLEGIAECDGKLYVANSYLKNDAGYQYQKELFVINADNMQLETTLAVDINPNQVLEEDGKIFLISWGNYADKGYSAQMIDPKNGNKPISLGVATNMTVGDDMVYFVNSETDWNTFTTTNTFFSYNIKTATVNSSSFLKNAPAELATSSVYMMSVDDEKGDIYIGVTFYSNSNGTMYRFDRNGNFVEKFDCGGQNPKTMVFIGWIQVINATPMFSFNF